MSKVILPRKATNGSESQPVVPAGQQPTIPAPPMERSERILLLEDEEQTNLILKEYLQSFGYRVVAVSNGVDGLKEVMKSDFELVICDMMMPRLPGDMFYLAVQKTRPKLCGRFVFITGHQGTPQIEAFIARTKAAILVKPFRLHQLEIALEGVLFRAAKKEEAAAPLRIVPNENFPKEHYSRPSSKEVPHQPAEKMPSMVAKALKLVGFMRKDEKKGLAPIAPPPSLSPQDAPRATRRIAQQSGQVTRRIPHLAITPIPQQASTAPAQDTTRRITRRLPTPSSTPPPSTPERPNPQPESAPRILPPPSALTAQPISAPEPAPTPVSHPAPEKTRVIKKDDPVTLRVKDQPSGAPSASLMRVTRKIASPAPAASTPKVTRAIPKPMQTIRVPHLTVKATANEKPAAQPPKSGTKAAPKAEAAPKTALKVVPKTVLKTVPEAAPVVTRKIAKKAAPKVTQKAPPKVTQNATQKVAPKVSRTIPAPVVSRRISTSKK